MTDVAPIPLLLACAAAALALALAARAFRADAIALAATPDGLLLRNVAAATATASLGAVAVLVVTLLAAEAEGPRVRLAHGTFVLGLWTLAGAASLGAVAARWRGRAAPGRIAAALLAGLVSADVTPLPRFLARFDPDAIAVAPLLGVALVLVGAATVASLAAAAHRGRGAP